MKIAVIGQDTINRELLAQGTAPDAELHFVSHTHDMKDADAVIDLLFDTSADRITQLQKWQPALILVNAVTVPLSELPPSFVRINGWPTLLGRTLTEITAQEDDRNKTEEVLRVFNKKPEWVPDMTGFITPRVISMVINEAYFALDEGVSERSEIDIAMKLGTNYPFGPFEWSAKIGLKNIYDLLFRLSKTNPRYEPSPLLTKEALSL